MPNIHTAPAGFVMNPDYLVSELRSEIERLMSTLAQVNAKCDSLGIRLGEVIKERDALRLDAERWRARVEQAFREGYWARETYNDNEVSDVNERWERAKVTLLAMPSTRR